MSIEEHCKAQRNTADKVFMDFKYTSPGSNEQVDALRTFHLLICLWANFLDKADTDYVDSLALEAVL